MYTLTKNGFIYKWIPGLNEELEYKNLPFLMYAKYTPFGKHRLHIKGSENKVINCASFHHSQFSDLLVIGKSNGVFSLFRMPSFELIHALSITNSDISACNINPNGEWLAFASAKKGQLFVCFLLFLLEIF